MSTTEYIQIIIGIGQIIAVAIIPIIVWVLGIKYQNRKAKKDAQLRVFLTLMADRKSTPITKEWVDALNTIDVVFQENKKVRHAWREYLDSLNEKSPHFDSSNSFRLDLLSEMAVSLGYKNLKKTELDRFYSPKYFGSQMSRQEILFQENLRILTRSKSCAESFTDEEYEQHYKEVTALNSAEFISGISLSCEIADFLSLIKGLNDNIHKGIKGETVCFSDLGEAYSGLSGKGGDDFGYGEPFITYMNVYQNTYISEKDYELVQIAPNEKQNSVQYGDALFTLSSETPEEVSIGAVYLGNTQKLYLNSFCFGIHFYDERVLPQYLAHFISSSSFRRAIYPLAQGSTRFNLQKNDFMKMKFLLPSLEKQGHIANTLDALHCRLANEKSLTEQYILLKKYLLSLMFI